jgi:hypothetical protein
MSDAQIFLLFGIAYAAMGIGGLISGDSYRKLTDSFASSPGLLLVTGLLAVVAGFLLVAFHNVWVMGWTVLITIFGWLSLVKGVLILVFPGFYAALSKSMGQKRTLMRVYPIVVLVLGVFFLLVGFGVL